VAAPHVDSSGVGASILSVREQGSTRLHRHALPDLVDVPAFGVEGHPAYIVHAAGRGWLDPVPDLVLSGANIGANTGRSVLHSGTVGAALAASLHGWRALAISLDTGPRIPEHPNWASIGAVLPEVLDLLLASEEGTVLNVNVPDRPAADLGPLREATLAAFGTVQIRVDERADGETATLHHTFLQVAEAEEGSDIALLALGHPTVTRLESVSDRPGVLTPAG
jgi:5'-nucleotidase